MRNKYKMYFGIDGPYFVTKSCVLEVAEIALQIIALGDFAKSFRHRWVAMYAFVLLANSVLVPYTLLRNRRDAFIVFECLLDIAYVAFNTAKILALGVGALNWFDVLLVALPAISVWDLISDFVRLSITEALVRNVEQRTKNDKNGARIDKLVKLSKLSLLIASMR